MIEDHAFPSDRQVLELINSKQFRLYKVMWCLPVDKRKIEQRIDIDLQEFYQFIISAWVKLWKLLSMIQHLSKTIEGEGVK